MLLCSQMRLVITFFLSLCFLLIRGYDHLYARAYNNPTCYSPAKLSAGSELGGLDNEKDKQTVIHKATSSDSETEAINARETEDDEELIAPRKYVEITNYFITFLQAHLAGDGSCYLKSRLPICEHFSYTSSDKYIVQRVIRV